MLMELFNQPTYTGRTSPISGEPRDLGLGASLLAR